ncbi:hypothetical protein [Dyella psychrodurans]|uniref:DUF1440 domain-containing protein n=1 Tax=Dyella psychrodurans TaxID=1927960 RepID=A0A370WWU5_9GAMM|nr:hypothetical protein [Dyella psychrodurans]RDS80623.1 hypothetical protein DWU99_18760 [Dyella psychrodurans]
MSIAHADSRAVAVNRFIASAALMVFLLASADLIFACTYWHQLYAVPWSRLVQNIAAGLLGKRSFAGGAPTVVLGALLQYFMMSIMVGAYYAISTRMHVLRERPWQYGLLYGVVLFVVMNFIVLPLSAAPKGPVVPSWIVGSVVVHLIIGVSIAHGARWAVRRD